jgi:NADH-quinone oxidoreductase subunit G
MIRVDGALREVEWNVALDYVSHALKDVANTHGGRSDRCAGFTAFNAWKNSICCKKLMSANGFGKCGFPSAPSRFFTGRKAAGAPWLGSETCRKSRTLTVLVVGSFLRKDHPLFAQRLRQLGQERWEGQSAISDVRRPLDQPARPDYGSSGRVDDGLGGVVKAGRGAQGRFASRWA